MAHKLSVGRIMARDFYSLGLSIWVGCFGLIALLFLAKVIGHPEDEDAWLFTVFTGAFALSATLSGALLVWRVRVIRRVFARGEVVRGRVRRIVEGDGECVGYAVFVYQYQGQEYHATVTEPVVGQAGVAPDDSVEIVVDPSKPSRAYISKLYL